MFNTPQTLLCHDCYHKLPCDVVANNDTVRAKCPKCEGNMTSIDSTIVDAISTLWKHGLDTEFSCGGHAANSEGVIKYPHVTFSYDERVLLFLNHCRFCYDQQESIIALNMWMSSISFPRSPLINIEIDPHMKQHATTEEIFDEFHKFLAYVVTKSVTFDRFAEVMVHQQYMEKEGTAVVTVTDCKTKVFTKAGREFSKRIIHYESDPDHQFATTQYEFLRDYCLVRHVD